MPEIIYTADDIALFSKAEVIAARICDDTLGRIRGWASDEEIAAAKKALVRVSAIWVKVYLTGKATMSAIGVPDTVYPLDLFSEDRVAFSFYFTPPEEEAIELINDRIDGVHGNKVRELVIRGEVEASFEAVRDTDTNFWSICSEILTDVIDAIELGDD